MDTVNKTNTVHDKNECIEEEKPVVCDIKIKCATISFLIDFLIDCFDVEGNLKNNSKFPHCFLLMHKWFMSSGELARRLLDRYQGQTPSSRSSHEKETQSSRSLKTCYVIRFWLKTFPSDFENDKSLKDILLQRLRSSVEKKGSKKEIALLSDLSMPSSVKCARKHTLKTRCNTKHVSLAFNSIDALTLSNQLTYLEWNAVKKITLLDYKNYVLNGGLKESPQLDRSIRLFNGLSQWIQCMILNQTTPDQRARIIHKFLKVAEYLRTQHNYNTLMAVVGGICHSSIARLSKTLILLSSSDSKSLEEFQNLLSSNFNYTQYRKAFQNAKGFKIPIIGVLLKDMIYFNTTMPDVLSNNMINFRKMAQLSVLVESVFDLQMCSPPYPANEDLISLLTLSLDLNYNEDDLYELSLAREPRDSLTLGNVPKKLPLFADWITGACSSPDPKTIQQHVRAMVEVVFCNYDYDHDGFISQREFDEIAQNFPFIDAFAVLDTNKDGVISRKEMHSYFLRANYLALGREFKHNFCETTYFKGTYCAHCSGRLWGLIKQGYKCKDCGINAHKHCKDTVVMECRSNKATSTSKNVHPKKISSTTKKSTTPLNYVNIIKTVSSTSSSSSCSSLLSSDNSRSPSSSSGSCSENEQRNSEKKRRNSNNRWLTVNYRNKSFPLIPRGPLVGESFTDSDFEKWSCRFNNSTETQSAENDDVLKKLKKTEEDRERLLHDNAYMKQELELLMKIYEKIGPKTADNTEEMHQKLSELLQRTVDSMEEEESASRI